MATWSGTRNKLENDYLAVSLRGRITYFTTSYSYAPDHIGRAAIRVDGIEVLKSDYAKLNQFQSESLGDIKKNSPEYDISDAWAESWKEAVRKGGFDNEFFYMAFNEFDNQSIEESLKSLNPLVRIFVVLDRRVGKRRLKELSELWSEDKEWVVFFLKLRMQAEGLS